MNKNRSNDNCTRTVTRDVSIAIVFQSCCSLKLALSIYAMKKTHSDDGCTNKAFLAASAQDGISCAFISLPQ